MGELLVLLGNSALNLGLDLGELHLASQDLVLLLLEGSLGFLKSGLELHLLSLEPLADFVNLVDGASSLGDLVHDVLDLIGQGLILTSDLLKLEDSLLVGRLDLEKLGRGISGLLLADIKIKGQAVNLALHLSDGLVELLGLPLHGGVDNLGLVKGGGHLGDLGLDLALVLLNLGELGVEVVNGSLSLGVPGGQLHLGHLELLSLGNSIGLVLLSHCSSISLGLGIESEDVVTSSGLFIKSLLGEVKFVLQVSVFAQQKLSLSGLIVTQSLDVIELSSKGGLGLGEHVEVVLKISNNAEKFSILVGNLVLGHAKVSKSEVGSINLLVDSIELVNKVLVGLVGRGLASGNLLGGSSGISDLHHDDLLVLLNLGLHLLESINLLLHLKNSITLLPLQVAEDRLAGNVGLLNILAELDNLSFTLLVELNLGNGGTAGLIVSLTELLNLTGEVRSLSLSLGTSLTLSLEFLLGSLNTGLEFLDVLLGLGDQGLLIIKLGRQHLDILFLGGNGVLNVSSFSLKISNSILGHLEVSLNLSLLLLKSSSGLLLLVKSSLKLIQSGLKLGLDMVQVLDLLLSRLKIFSRLGLGGGQVLLLLVQLVDDLILLSDLVLEGLDGMVTVALLGLDLGDGELNILNVLLDSSNAARVGLDLSSQSNSGLLLALQDLGSRSKFDLSGGLDLVGLGLSVGVDGDAALLLSQLLGHGTNLVLQTSKTGLELSSLVKSGLVLAIGGIGLLFKQSEFLLGIGKTNESSGLLDDDEPSPISHLEILSEVPLSNLDEFSLISLLLIDTSTDSLESFSLDESDPFDDQVITSFLKLGKSSSSEEDKGVSKPVSLSVKANLVHEGIGGSLVVRG